ncbi:NAD(P)H-quinone oxidoreductase subunit 5 [Blastomonas natatoria]|uniref:Probable inorganic carbon transporter subunit DabB n=1 Tax=Blastomonas natatoria TaxID=34015 RepID=A0A2V3VBE3_9SPHN|nr:proton-conducting transporter membrane subunit [Blastomonas natatoria]PXW79122.1 NAD(P)H-quinone oxidoreductase subunit 5 [Blastomonas natatoria]
MDIALGLAIGIAAFTALGAAALLAGDHRARLTGPILEAGILACLGLAIAALAQLIMAGPVTADLLVWQTLGFSLRLDAVSLPITILVAFVGWVVLRYSRTYLGDEPRRARFQAWLSFTLASVLMFALAGNLVQLVLFWVTTSFSLHRLLLFYPDRAAARRAARKKYITARIADLALIGSAALLFAVYATGDITTILQAAQGGESSTALRFAVLGLALAAVIKSAQFPLHGWLTEVMEAPTPVSALLHAGVINAGGFLLIRFADVMLLSPAVMAGLVMIGGFTAMFGGLVMLTQPAVKTSLAWSTVAQMGFMIMQCGLALFPLAMLHIIAHSLYKAHSFLASGGAVERIAALRRPGPVAIPGAKAVTGAFLAALAIYVAIGFAFRFQDTSPQSIALGAILIFGVAYLLAQGLAGAAPVALMRRMVAYSLAASLGYFALHHAADALLLGTLPMPPAPGPLEWVLIMLAVVSFGLVAIAQSMFPLWAYHPAAAGLRVHLSNGLYANAVFDRLLGGWTLKRSR